jgi:hypothetical protein
MATQSCLKVDRDTALWALAKDRLGELTNAEIEERLDEFAASRDYSIVVVDEVEDEEDCDILRDML